MSGIQLFGLGFGCGLLGAFLAYCIGYVLPRYDEVFTDFSTRWPYPLIWAIIFLLCGALCAGIIVYLFNGHAEIRHVVKEGIIIGAGLDSIISSFIIGRTLTVRAVTREGARGLSR